MTSGTSNQQPEQPPTVFDAATRQSIKAGLHNPAALAYVEALENIAELAFRQWACSNPQTKSSMVAGSLLYDALARVDWMEKHE